MSSTLHWLRLAANDALLAAEATDAQERTAQSGMLMVRAREFLAAVDVYLEQRRVRDESGK